MLFRTVYGPELEAIYCFIVEANEPPSRKLIQSRFLPQRVDDQHPSTQNIDDALSFLESARLIDERNGSYTPNFLTNEPFRVLALSRLRALELALVEPRQPIDSLYTLLLTELFIQPNQLFVANVHHEANKLRLVADMGGLSREKVQAWKRVMEFLGVGRRVMTGFLCAYSSPLLLEILSQWPPTEGTMQSFLEEHFNRILPFQTKEGHLAHAVEEPLAYLETQGCIVLAPLQDSPSKPYFGERRVKHIACSEIANVI